MNTWVTGWKDHCFHTALQKLLGDTHERIIEKWIWWENIYDQEVNQEPAEPDEELSLDWKGTIELFFESCSVRYVSYSVWYCREAAFLMSRMFVAHLLLWRYHPVKKSSLMFYPCSNPTGWTSETVNVDEYWLNTFSGKKKPTCDNSGIFTGSFFFYFKAILLSHYLCILVSLPVLHCAKWVLLTPASALEKSKKERAGWWEG